MYKTYFHKFWNSFVFYKIFYPFYKFIQRGKRGFSDEDLSSFDYYLFKMMTEVITKFEKNTMPYPCDNGLESHTLCNCKEK